MIFVGKKNIIFCYYQITFKTFLIYISVVSVISFEYKTQQQVVNVAELLSLVYLEILVCSRAFYADQHIYVYMCIGSSTTEYQLIKTTRKCSLHQYRRILTYVLFKRKKKSRSNIDNIDIERNG